MAGHTKREAEVVAHFKQKLLALGYNAGDFRENFTIQKGSQRYSLDLAVFKRNVTGVRYQKKNISMIVECKERGISDQAFANGQEQLESYLGACMSTTYGVLTRQDTWIVLHKRHSKDADGAHVDWVFVAEPDGPIPSPEDTEEPEPLTIFLGRRRAPAPQQTPTVAAAPPLLAAFCGERWYAVVETPFVIGREPHADLQIDDPDISREHAAVIFEQGQHYIVDTQSRKGIRHGRKRIQRKAIVEGDVFRLNGHEVCFTYQGRRKKGLGALAMLLRFAANR